MSAGQDTLLLVDDDCLILDAMQRRLSRRGFNVMLRSGGQEAIDWIRENRTDLVLLDVDMPGMNGVEALTTLRKTYTPAQLPVIMVTGKTSSEDVVKALEAGANDYVTKPIDFPVVLARIQNQLSRKHAEEALRESEERYALAARGANDGLWDWDLSTNKMYLSPRWKSMLGWQEYEIVDDPDEWFKRIHPDDVHRVRADISAHLQELTAHFENEYRMLHRDGNYLWMLGRGLAVKNGNGKASRIAGSQTDITRGKVADVLTGLPNRVLFLDRLGRAFERARRQINRTCTLIFIDVDSFKLINDSLGHLAGDQLLVAIAARLESAVRFSDTVSRFGRNHTVARLGGDEFTVLLEDIADPADALRIAERISKTLSKPYNVGGQELFVTVSMGIAPYDPSYERPEDMLRDADTAMYRAKNLGKNRCEVFDANMRASAVARLLLETELRHALERREYELYYQALIALEPGTICGFESLIRWNHPTRGAVTPREFIPVLEETNLIVPVGEWGLHSACQQLHAWQARFGTEPPLTVSVNLSGRHFLRPELLEQCRSILAKSHLAPCSLILEITESAVMPNPEASITLMNNLQALGIHLALDDFGTGYSSLSYLHRFPINNLKIDRSFIARVTKDDEIVRTIITLGRNLNLKVIAEGVETEEQLAKLRELGCEYAQGFLFSRPVSAEEATDLIAAKPRW